MKKKKLIATVIAVIIASSMFSVIPIQAAVDKALLAQAESYGIDVTGMTKKEIRNEVKDYKKEWTSVNKQIGDLGIDVTGLTLEEAKNKLEGAQAYIEANSDQGGRDVLVAIETAIKAIKENNENKLMKVLDDLESCLPGISSLSYPEAKKTIILALQSNAGVDITVLTTKEAIRQVESSIMKDMQKEAEHYGVDISGLSFQEAQKVLDATKIEYMMKEYEELYAKAKEYGIDITGLDKQSAWDLIKKAEMEQTNQMDEQKKQEELNKCAAQYGIDISGLSVEEAWKKVDEAVIKECIQYAKEHDIDLSGLTSEQIKEKVNIQRMAIEQEELVAQAQKFGVDITGLSREEAWNLVKKTELNEYAKQYNIDINGLSIDQAWEKIKMVMKEEGNQVTEAVSSLDQLKAQAEEYNIDITGLSEDEIQARIDEATAPEKYRLYLEDQAKAFQFDPSGMTNDEIEKKLDEAMAQSCLQDAARVGYQEAVEEAKNYGIDTTGLTTQEINDKICEVIRYNQMHENLQQQAVAMGISIDGMTNDEAQKYILKVDQERRDAADAERNAKQDAENAAILEEARQSSGNQAEFDKALDAALSQGADFETALQAAINATSGD